MGFRDQWTKAQQDTRASRGAAQSQHVDKSDWSERGVVYELKLKTPLGAKEIARFTVYPDRIDASVAKVGKIAPIREGGIQRSVGIDRIGGCRVQKDGMGSGWSITVEVNGEDDMGFGGLEERDAKECRDAVMDLVTNRAGAVASPRPNDDAEQIRKLASLRDDGILTEAEFEAKKRAILGL